MANAFDVETFPTSAKDPLPQLVCMSFATANGVQLVDHLDAPRVFRWLADQRATMTGHNTSFDLGVLARADATLLPLIFEVLARDQVSCTMLREQLTEIREGTFTHHRKQKGYYGLGQVAKRHLGYELNKDDAIRLGFGHLFGTPIQTWPVEARNYATADSASTRQVWLDQVASPDEGLQVRAAFALQMTAATGYVTDPEAVDRLELRVIEGMLEHDRALKEAGIIRSLRFPQENGKPWPKSKLGTTDLAALRARIQDACAKQGVFPALTDHETKPQIATGEDAIADLDDPVLQSRVEYARLKKVLTTYVPMLRLGLEHPVHTHYHLLETGRNSSAEPSVQLFPRAFKVGGKKVDAGVRECIVPRKGNVFVSCDLTVAELRGISQIVYSWIGWSTMRDALVRGLDPHLVLAASILGISVEDAHRRFKAEDPTVIEARQTAKSANFGLLGGLGAPAFVVYLRGQDRERYGDVTEDRAREIKAIWLDTWPEFREYFKIIGDITGDFGPREIVQYGSGRVRGGVTFTEAANGYFQSIVADTVKSALFEVVRRCLVVRTSALFGTKPQFFQHDELVLEADERQAPYAAVELEQVMLEAQARWMPDIPPACETTLSRRFSKRAKPVRDRAGLLIPWEDRPRAA